MGNGLDFNPSIQSQFLYPPGLFTKKEEETALPNIITGAKNKVKDSTDELIKTNHSDNSQSPTSYETKDISLANKLKEIQSLLGKKVDTAGTQQLEFQFSFEKTEEFYFQFLQKTKSVENNLSSTFSKKLMQKLDKKLLSNLKLEVILVQKEW